MPSQLSSLLVRDGLTTPRRIERALMQQVVRGGSLDTVLLEMGAVPEDRLTQYLSLATGLPPASKTETDVFDADAVACCPREMSERYRVAPLQLSDSTLKVIVCEPVDRVALQRLADEVGCALQPLVVPEYRFNVIFSRVFDLEASERFEQLAHRQRGVTFAATGGAETVILESQSDVEDRVVVDTPLESASRDQEPLPRSEQDNVAEAETHPVARQPADSLAMGSTEEMPAQAVPEEEAQPSVAQVEAALEAATREEEEAAEIAAQAQAAEAREERTEEPTPAAEQEPMQAAEQEPTPAAEQEPTPAEEIPEGTGPLTLGQARAALAESFDRDEIFELLLRGLRSVARFAALLTIQKQGAVGRRALHDGSFPDDIGSVSIPLTESSAYRNANQSGAPFIGPMRSGSADVDEQTRKLGVDPTGSALILPISLRGRVVALAVAHSGSDVAWIGAASSSFILAKDVAEAIERLLASKSKAPKGDSDEQQNGTRRSGAQGKRKRSKTNAEGVTR